MNKPYRYISRNKPPAIPKEIAVCPKCGAEIAIVEISEWCNDGRVTDGGLAIACKNEPDDEPEDEYRDWLNWHYSTPYIDWLPIQETVYRWFDAHYRLVDDRYEGLDSNAIKTFWVKEVQQ